MNILIDLGVRFVRIERGSKRPIEQWKTESRSYNAEEYSRVMLGFNVGVVADDRLVMLDVEGPKKTGCANGWPHLQALQQGHEDFPTTLQYLTPSGGCGFIFKKPAHRRVPFFDLSQRFGLELRTGMHYSLIPDSYYDGKIEGKSYAGSYTWVLGPEDLDELPECPAWLIDWFESQFVKANDDSEGRTPTVGAHEESGEYFNCIANNIYALDPDMSYPSWWRVMAVCHRCGDRGLDLFVEWSRRGAKHKGAETDAFIYRQWQELNTRTVEKRVGITWLLDLIKFNQPVIHLPESVDLQPSKMRGEDLWPLIPLTGCLEKFRQQLEASMPWQSEANYVVPLICAQAAFQRRVLFMHEGLQSHWWAMIGAAASNKTTMRNIIRDVIKNVDSRMTFDSFESPNGIKAMFAEYPSRFLVIDEGLKLFNATLANEGRNTLDARVIGLLLNLHNNKSDQDGTHNRIKAHRLPAVVLPQLGIVTFDQTSYWETFRTNSAAMNGMISRFALFKLNQMPLESINKDSKRVTGLQIEEFSRSLNKLIPRTPVFNLADPDDYYSWSPIKANGEPDFTINGEAKALIDVFNDGLVEWATQDDNELRVSIMTRTVEFATMISQLIAVCDRSYVVEAAHMRAAIGIAYRSLKNLSLDVNPMQNQIIQLAAAVLKQHGPQRVSAVIKALPRNYWRGSEGWAQCRQVICDHFELKGKIVQPFHS